MKFGPRRPSLKGRIAARTSWKRYARHSLGFKAPRGWGWLTNPKRAAYNRIYSRTTFDLFATPKGGRRRRSSPTGGPQASSLGRLVVVVLIILALIGLFR